MTALELLVLLLFAIAVVLFIIALAVPNPRAKEWSYGFFLAAFGFLAWGAHLIK